jgi:hypothetical protein
MALTTTEEKMSFDDEEEELEQEEEAIKEWDEGGPSDCGYNETIHSTLMSVGKTVHTVVGAPGERVRSVQTTIGNWFQELSYAARDIVRGENTKEMHEDATTAVMTLINGGEPDPDKSMDQQNKPQDP